MDSAEASQADSVEWGTAVGASGHTILVIDWVFHIRIGNSPDGSRLLRLRPERNDLAGKASLGVRSEPTAMGRALAVRRIRGADFKAINPTEVAGRTGPRAHREISKAGNLHGPRLDHPLRA
jgi:hypothetical protein